jgi:hypothetical protein
MYHVALLLVVVREYTEAILVDELMFISTGPLYVW